MATPLGLDLHLGKRQPQVAKSQGAPRKSSSCPLSPSQGGQYLRDTPQPQHGLCGQVKPSALQWGLARPVSSWCPHSPAITCLHHPAPTHQTNSSLPFGICSWSTSTPAYLRIPVHSNSNHLWVTLSIPRFHTWLPYSPPLLLILFGNAFCLRKFLSLLRTRTDHSNSIVCSFDSPLPLSPQTGL